MKWSVSERAAAFEAGQEQGRGPAVPASKGFSDNVKAAERMKKWQKELAAGKKTK